MRLFGDGESASLEPLKGVGLDHSPVAVDLNPIALDGYKVAINSPGEVIKPNTSKRLQGLGLPFSKEPQRRGDLIVNFDVVFPDQLSTSAKQTIYNLV